MKLLADESVDQPIVDRLRQDGHDVVYVAELSPGIGDDDVLEQASRNNSTLLTGDKDFGELVFRQGRAHGGVILIRLLGIPADRKAAIVAEVIRSRAAGLHGAFSVISPGMVRTRPPR